jgi:hypothetical protein
MSLLLGQSLLAQADLSTFKGMVRDAQGNTVADAHVALLDPFEKTVMSARTDAPGRNFTFRNSPASRVVRTFSLWA